MKSILLIRHAKSSWELNVQDFDRPLNPRGETDAAAMAKRLQKKEVKIDAFVSSPAKRALTTATIFAGVYEYKTKKIITDPCLYEPSVQAFFHAIEGLDNEIKRVAVFSHNPGITAFVNQLTEANIDDMPTCAVFALKADIKTWKEFSSATKDFWFFDYPKASR